MIDLILSIASLNGVDFPPAPLAITVQSAGVLRAGRRAISVDIVVAALPNLLNMPLFGPRRGLIGLGEMIDSAEPDYCCSFMPLLLPIQ